MNKRNKDEPRLGIINLDTGVIEEYDVIEEKVDKSTWARVWGKQLAAMLDVGGEDKTRVIATLIRSRDAMNFIHLTVGEIAERSKTSTKTVSRTLKSLEDAGFIVRIRQGKIMLSPKVMCRGDRAMGMAVIHTWEELEQEN